MCSRLEADYVRLFINNKEGLTAPLYESCYGPGQSRTMGKSALAMRNRLEKAGLKPSGNLAGEPPDHLCIQLEYLFVLLVRGWSSSDTSFLHDARIFAGEIQPWIRKFRAAIAIGDSMKFYFCCADYLVTLLDEIISS